MTVGAWGWVRGFWYIEVSYIVHGVKATQGLQDGSQCGIGVVFRMDTHGPHPHSAPIISTSDPS